MRARSGRCRRSTARAPPSRAPLTRLLVRDQGKIFPVLVDDDRAPALRHQVHGGQPGAAPISCACRSRLRGAARSRPLPEGEPLVHRQPRLRRLDDAGRKLAARAAPARRHAGHGQPRSLEATEGRFAMNTRAERRRDGCPSPPCSRWPRRRAAQGVEGRKYAPGPFDTLVIYGSAAFSSSRAARTASSSKATRERRTRPRSMSTAACSAFARGCVEVLARQAAQIAVTARELKRIEIRGAADVVAAEPLR